MIRCACCGKSVESLQDVEPFFGLPDIIHRLPREDIGEFGRGVLERRAMVSPDACTLDFDDEVRGQCFLRLVLPFTVADRAERLFHYGIWVKVSRTVSTLYAEAYAQDMGHPTAKAEPVVLAAEYSGKLANDLGPRIGTTSTLDRVVVITTKRGRERWSARFTDADGHPIAEMQRQGISLATVLEWTRPLHRAVN